MNQVNCPYIKISEAEANKIAMNVSNISSVSNFSLASKAYAQNSSPDIINNVVENINDQLTTPFLLLVASFFLFCFLMSAVYMYHWFKFSLNDPFIKNFLPVYFLGLLTLSLPLIYNLFF